MKICIVCLRELPDNLAYVRCHSCELDFRDNKVYKSLSDNLELNSFDKE